MSEITHAMNAIQIIGAIFLSVSGAMEIFAGMRGERNYPQATFGVALVILGMVAMK